MKDKIEFQFDTFCCTISEIDNNYEETGVHGLYAYEFRMYHTDNRGYYTDNIEHLFVLSKDEYTKFIQKLVSFGR